MSNQVLATSSLLKALPLIDSIKSSKFPLLLDRIAKKLEENDFKTKLFSEEEEEKLVLSLGIDKESLTLVLDSSVNIFEQAAFHMIKPSSLSRQLQSLNLSPDNADLFAQAWGAHAKGIVDRLRRISISPCELQDVSWSLNLQMASKVRAKQRCPLAMMEFHLKSDEGSRNVHMEFNHEELFQFYKTIDRIQSQLDALK
ncbi:hypothetical protein J437_LFUL000296 [Ladona fulva]|uniref:COMM domain-containing protein n=1 Tax=Ladona fulva TaxID=123851 RepID=A0A8K0K379_LADFU|nr:hypothetical protein J437_LFUL000296 [Ladona fulva]